jgi:hypothetical protein
MVTAIESYHFWKDNIRSYYSPPDNPTVIQFAQYAGQPLEYDSRRFALQNETLRDADSNGLIPYAKNWDALLF